MPKNGRNRGWRIRWLGLYRRERNSESSSKRTEKEEDIVTCKIIYVAPLVVQFYLHGGLRTSRVKIWRVAGMGFNMLV